MAGSFFSVMVNECATIVIAEGVATALSIHHATGLSVVAAMCSGNLSHVALAIRLKYPAGDIVIAADNDRGKELAGEPNVGLLAARAAASLIDAKIAIPVDDDVCITDFNDVASRQGARVVRDAIQNAPYAEDWRPRLVAMSVDTRSDLANAHRLYRWCGIDHMFHPKGGWLKWGPGWVPDSSGMQKAAAQLSQLVMAEASAAEQIAATEITSSQPHSGSLARDLRQWAVKCESSAKIKAAATLARELLTVESDVLDQDRWLFGCQNGVVDLRKLKFRPHHRADFITQMAGCAFDKDADCPNWKQFIFETYVEQEDLIDFMHRFLGHLLLGERREELLVILYGGGRNGKGTLLELLQYVLGEYAITAQPDLLMARHSDRHLTELADLAGRRLVVCTESGREVRLFTERVKALTGRDRINARRTHRDGFVFVPQHQLVLQTNHLPKILDQDLGTWRRIRVIPHLAVVDEQQEDKGLRDRLYGEAPGILNWLIDGLRKYLWYGLKDVPSAVRAATNAYRVGASEVQRFVNERCDRKSSGVTTAAELYAAYETWAEHSTMPKLSKKMFGIDLAGCGLKVLRKRDARCWQGIRVKSRQD